MYKVNIMYKIYIKLLETQGERVLQYVIEVMRNSLTDVN